MNLEWLDLPELFPDFEQPGRWLPLLERHAALLEGASTRVRVTSVAPAEAVRRQYAESLELLRVIEAVARGSEALADIGSGGGFPGVVMAIARPAMHVHLVEPLQKRAALLAELSRELGLANVTVHAIRAEEAGRGALRESQPVVTARAVAELRELVEYTSPLAQVGGVLALPKGSALERELAAAAESLTTLGCLHESSTPMRAEISSTLSVAVFRKTAATPAGYPRRAGVPGKRPL
ncbi:MAG: 16S rRNA (guanine(527)-N(7))-methyltransferase RsmG [Tepidiformaceae bacterium]